ncbi:MAG TPA: ribosome recycling factor [Myxococcota bacterium]|jgi:ribosome recycling factor|nr:ribosome recycling factor [Myxococcota bacterium]HHW97898.1 ribosome recycling factor [Oligoflexales bacterium]HOE81911.1 ribosome recycling factor [Myxococcota bacterium]HON25892.1 ribosome recycling factor [Myxococcota bacterium]HOS61280.1 ribosome recycling factor [Myxococcota bacterium]
MIETTIVDLSKSFDKAIEAFERDLSRVRTGRANLAILEGLKVEYYGVPSALSQVAALTVPEPRLIIIRPWDKKLIGAIEKAVTIADLGLTPSNDGDVVRLPIPPLTTDRRKELVKQVRKLLEDAKISLRNLRREARSKLEKADGLPEDEVKRALDRIDKETEKYIKDTDEIAAQKEKEIMEF